MCFVAIQGYAQVNKTEDSLKNQAPSLIDLMNIKISSATNMIESKSSSPATVYVITEEDIFLNGYTNLLEALESVPGVTPINSSFFAFGGQRGFLGNFSQSLIMINGREMQNLIAAETFISHQFTTHNIKQIEVLQGPASSVYGANAFVGIINIITINQDKEFEGIAVEAIGGSQNTKSVGSYFRSEFKNIEINGSFKIFETDGWDYSDFVKDTNDFSEGFSNIARNNSSDNQYHNYSKAIPYSSEIRYNGFYAGTNGFFMQNGKGLENVSLAYDHQRDFRKFNNSYLGCKKQFGENNKLNIEYQYSSEKAWGYNYNFDQDIYETLLAQGKDSNALLTHEEVTDDFLLVYSQENSSGSKRHKAFVTWESVIKKRLQIMGGYVFDNYDLLAFVVSRSDLFPEFDETVSDSNNLRKSFFNSSRNSVFLHSKLSLLENRLFITLGGRGDYHSIYGFVPTFRSGIVYKFGNQTFAKGMFGQAFREPTIFELGGGKGGSLIELNPTTINTFELSLTHNFSDKILSNLVLFKNVATNFITQSTTDEFFNSSEKYSSQGLELLLNYTLEKFKGDVFYTFTNTTGDSLGGDMIGSLNVYPHRMGVGITYNPWKFININARFNYYSEVVANHGNPGFDESIVIPQATKINLTFSAKDLTLEDYRANISLVLNNLLDQNIYQPNVRRSGPKQFLHPGRSLLIKLNIEI